MLAPATAFAVRQTPRTNRLFCFPSDVPPMESCALAPLRGTPDAISLKVSLAKCGAERFSRQPRYLHGCHLHFLTQFAGLNALLLKQGNFALIITNTISKTTDLPMQRRTVSAAFSDESADFLPSVSAKTGFRVSLNADICLYTCNAC